TVNLAESTDQYAIIIFEENGMLQIVWEEWKNRESKTQNLNKTSIPHQAFYSAIDEFLLTINSAYPKT
ncbi:hypothetical protein, partial [Rhizobium leguminosarum]|uniref:hypothetical protein n=1 Tax=Rhizobium leguminosarum TaxID=384 RepID=UPI003F953109